jgi:hypothetical protein
MGVPFGMTSVYSIFLYGSPAFRTKLAQNASARKNKKDLI